MSICFPALTTTEVSQPTKCRFNLSPSTECIIKALEICLRFNISTVRTLYKNVTAMRDNDSCS